VPGPPAPVKAATAKRPWIDHTPMSRQEILNRLMATIPARGSIEDTDLPDSPYPKLRYVMTPTGFRLQWGWSQSLWVHKRLRSLHDARLHVAMSPGPDGTTVSYWLRSGPWGLLPIACRLLTFLGFGFLILTETHPGPGLIALVALLGIIFVAAAWARYPLAPVWGDTQPLLEALGTVLEPGAAAPPTPLSSSDAGARG